jgi:hypothetical protein
MAKQIWNIKDTEINFSLIKKNFVNDIVKELVYDCLADSFKNEEEDIAIDICNWAEESDGFKSDVELKDKIFRELITNRVIVVDCKSKREFIKKYVNPMFKMVKDKQEQVKKQEHKALENFAKNWKPKILPMANDTDSDSD